MASPPQGTNSFFTCGPADRSGGLMYQPQHDAGPGSVDHGYAGDANEAINVLLSEFGRYWSPDE